MELFRQVFNYLDKSKRGIVYPEYFGELLRVSGFNPTEAEIADLKSKYGNQRGITFDDYITLISGLDCIGIPHGKVITRSDRGGYPESLQSVRQIQRWENQGGPSSQCSLQSGGALER